MMQPRNKSRRPRRDENQRRSRQLVNFSFQRMSNHSLIVAVVSGEIHSPTTSTATATFEDSAQTLNPGDIDPNQSRSNPAAGRQSGDDQGPRIDLTQIESEDENQQSCRKNSSADTKHFFIEPHDRITTDTKTGKQTSTRVVNCRICQ
jgi:hypothetical protein